MTRRLLAICIAILVLIGLIIYSQYRPQVDRVSGFIEADEIRVGSRLGGRVSKVYVEEGEQVTQGQVLLELEPYDLLQREQEAVQTLAARDATYDRLAGGFRPEDIAQAKANHDQFKARLDLLEAGPRAQEIAAARARVDVADAELTLAQGNYERRSKLFQTNAVAREELDQASEQLALAEALVIVRKEELELLEIGTREEEIREARARVEQAYQAWQRAENGYEDKEVEAAKAARDAAEAALDVIREQKKELTVTSPIDGVIEALDLLNGDLVGAGAPILSIMDQNRMWVRAYVPQNRVGLQIGEQLQVTVDSFENESFLGEVQFIARQAEFTPSNVQTPEERAKQVFRIKVALRDGFRKLRPGMTADVWLKPAGETQ